MNFFRLRVINTLLLFLIGIVLGFILKESFHPAPKAPAPASYHSSYQAGEEVSVTAQPEAEEPADEPYQVREPDSSAAEARESAEVDQGDAARNAPEALVIEASGAEGDSSASKKAIVKGAQDLFFRNPAAYEGRELEMELQMITAKRNQAGWSVNLVYTGPDKKIDYLYVDDTELLGEKPDFRIGYVYKVRFLCGKGDTASGNTLQFIAATGNKAAWATGLSAVE